MDIFFSNPNDVPVPPDHMQIRTLTATPYSDGRRVTVDFEMTPFQQRPNLEILVFNHEKQLVSSLSVVEAIENKMTFTLHLRETEPKGDYQLNLQIFYTELDTLDEADDLLIKDIILEKKDVVATEETTFHIPHPHEP